MCTEIHIVFYFERHKGIDVFIQEDQSVVGTVYGLTGKFIHASSGLEAKLLEDGEWCFRGQTVDI